MKKKIAFGVAFLCMCMCMCMCANFLAAQTKPVLTDIKFLASGIPISQTSFGDVTVELIFDGNMDQTVDPVVKFGQASPFELSVPKGSGWISETLWQGFFTVSENNPQTGDGEYIFKVFGAKDLAGTEMDTTLSSVLEKTLLICRVGELNLKATSLDFGTVDNGSLPIMQVVVTNESCADLHVNAVVVPHPFVLINSLPNFTILGGESKTLDIRFDPTSRTDYSGTMTIFSDDPDSTHTVALSGSAKGPKIDLLPVSSLSFGNVEVGFDSTRTVQVINVEASDPTLSDTLMVTNIFTNNAVYSVDSTEVTVAPGDTKTVSITFTPTANLDYNNRFLSFANNDLTQSLRTLVLNGTANDQSPPPAVEDLIVTWSGPSGLTNSAFLPICWDNPADASGIAEIWWKFVTSPNPPTSAADTTNQGGRIILGSQSCASIPLLGSLSTGFWYCYVWLVDGSGNSGWASAVATSFIYDITAPDRPTIASRTIPELFWFANDLFQLTIGIPVDADRGTKDASEVRWKYQSPPANGLDFDGSYILQVFDNDPVTFTVPFIGENLCGIDSLYVWLADSSGNSNGANTTIVPYRFDICPPEISRVLPEIDNVANLGEAFLDTVLITDDVGLDTVWVRYRFGGADAEEPPRPATQIGNTDNYVVDIPAAGVTRRGVEYQMFATDLLGNQGGGPGLLECSDDDNDDDDFWFPIRTRVADDFRIDSDGRPVPLIAGDNDANYQLFSIPYDLDDNDVMQVLQDDLGTYDITQWRFFDYKNDDPNNIRFVEGDTARDFTPGRSYFVITRQENIVVDSGPGLTRRTVCPDTLRLYEGWNLIATPFNFPVDKESLSLINSNTNISLRSYESGWNITDFMDPWKGYAVYVTGGSDSGNDDEIYLVVQPKAAEGRIDKVNIPLAQGEWLIQISARSGKVHDLDNWAGLQANAETGFDRLELAEPPVIGKYVQVSFAHPEWEQPAKEFSTDIRPMDSGEQVWEFQVKTNQANSTVNLSFDFLGDFPQNSEIFLIDEDLQLAQNLRATPAYAFKSGETGSDKTLKLIVGSPGFAQTEAGEIVLVPDEFALLQNFPNPFNPATNIRYNLSNAANVKLLIYDMLGRRVRTLLNSEQQSAGYYTVNWDGRDDAGQQVASGVYIYRISTSEKSIARKMILMK